MREEEERSRREQQAKEEEEEGTHEEEDEGTEQDEGKEEEEEGEREKQQRMSKGKASSPSLSPSFVVRRLSASSWSREVCRGRGMFLGVGLASSTVFPRGHFVVLSRLLAAPGRGDGLHPEADNADVGVLRPQGSEVDPWDPSRGACGAHTANRRPLPFGNADVRGSALPPCALSSLYICPWVGFAALAPYRPAARYLAFAKRPLSAVKRPTEYTGC